MNMTKEIRKTKRPSKNARSVEPRYRVVEIGNGCFAVDGGNWIAVWREKEDGGAKVWVLAGE